MPTWDNMVYQARTEKLTDKETGAVLKDKDGKALTKLPEFNHAMRDDRVAGEAVQKQCENEPSDKRYRKHAFIQWGQFERDYGRRSEVGERDEAVPMTRKVFGQWAKHDQGEDSDGCEEWWNEMLDDTSVERDEKGRKGALQLYVPQKTIKFRQNLRFQGSRAVEGSAKTKDWSADEMVAYRTQFDRQRASYTSDWLRGAQSSGSKDRDDEDSDGGPTSPQKEVTKTPQTLPSASPPRSSVKMRKGEISAVRAAVFDDIMDQKLDKMKSSMQSAMESVEEGWKIFKEERSKGPASLSLTAFAKVAHGKVSAAAAWQQVPVPNSIDSVTGGAAKVEDTGPNGEMPGNITDAFQQYIWKHPTPKPCQKVEDLRSFAEHSAFAQDSCVKV